MAEHQWVHRTHGNNGEVIGIVVECLDCQHGALAGLVPSGSVEATQRYVEKAVQYHCDCRDFDLPTQGPYTAEQRERMVQLRERQLGRTLDLPYAAAILRGQD